MPAGQAAVVVPAGMIELDEPDAALGQPPGQQAVGRERARLAGVGAVKLEDVFGLASSRFITSGTEVCIRYAISYWAIRAWIAGSSVARTPSGAARAGGRASCGGRRRRPRAGCRGRAPGRPRRGTGPPGAPRGGTRCPRAASRAAGRSGRSADQDAERGQVLVRRAQAVAEPRPHRRPPRDLRAGLEERDRRVVVDRLGVHRADEAELVDDLGRLRQELADPGADCPCRRELEDRAGQRQGRLVRRHARQPLPHPDRVGQVLAVHPVQQRLVIEQVELRRPAAHEQVDDPLRPGRKVRRRARPGTPGSIAADIGRAASASPARPPSPSKLARAIDPSPRLVREKKCRRFSSQAIDHREWNIMYKPWTNSVSRKDAKK